MSCHYWRETAIRAARPYALTAHSRSLCRKRTVHCCFTVRTASTPRLMSAECLFPPTASLSGLGPLPSRAVVDEPTDSGPLSRTVSTSVRFQRQKQLVHPDG